MLKKSYLIMYRWSCSENVGHHLEQSLLFDKPISKSCCKTQVSKDTHLKKMQKTYTSGSPTLKRGVERRL